MSSQLTLAGLVCVLKSTIRASRHIPLRSGLLFKPTEAGRRNAMAGSGRLGLLDDQL